VTSAEATLTVGEQPVIDTPPVSQEICLGDAVEFSVAVSGAGPFTYQWRLDGEIIPSATAATYSIAEASQDDIGSYDVVVTAPCGTITSNAAILSFGAAPTIDTPPTSQDLCVGGALSLTVVASGSGDLTYQWRKDGTPINGAVGAALMIEPVSLVDAGGYDVVISNECGSVTSPVALVTIGDGPEITTQPGALSVCEGEPATFSVVATGNGTLSYQWRKNGGPITGANGSSYMIAAVTAGDLGDYDVVVTDACGSVTSNAVALSFGAPPSITMSPESMDVCEGDEVTLVAAASGPSDTTLEWRKNGTPIAGATSATLVIPSAALGDAGSYVLVATSACGTAMSNPAVVTVGAGTAIVSQPSGAEICAGESLVLAVEATGTGAISYQWLQDGAIIPGVTGASYMIASATSADSGTYTGRVTSDCGTIESEAAEVLVLDPPAITSQPVSTEVCIGQEATFKVQASGGGLSYQWRLDGTPIEDANGPMLTVAAASLADAGEYDVVVTGTCGEATSSKAILSVVGTPIIVGQPVGGSFCPGEEVSLAIDAAGAEPLNYVWFRNGSEIFGMNGPTLVIDSFDPEVHSGLYHVLVESPCGSVGSDIIELSESLICGVRYIRGDSNQDGKSDISDAIFHLNYLFRGTADPTCLLALDTNDDENIDLSDVVYLLNWQFRGGPPLPPPNTATGCGFDPTPSNLTCEMSTCQ